MEKFSFSIAKVRETTFGMLKADSKKQDVEDCTDIFKDYLFTLMQLHIFPENHRIKILPIQTILKRNSQNVIINQELKGNSLSASFAAKHHIRLAKKSERTRQQNNSLPPSAYLVSFKIT